MHSIIIVLPYFGKFPNYFDLFLKSCAANKTINWLLITDQDTDSTCLPDNFIVRKTSFCNIQSIAKEKYGVAPATPYDLCKYRVVYHEMFWDEIKDYDFWGFCDCDLIFGNLRELITNDVLDKYDKISWRGHLTLFKNISQVNNAYKSKIPGYKTFLGCIHNSEGINLFDEVGINKIFNYLGLKIYEDLPFADLAIRNNNFICHHDIFEPDSNIHQIFQWTEQRLYRVFAHNETIHKMPVAYVHFLKRPMKWDDKSIINDSSYLIVPNKFIKDEDLSLNKVLEYSKKRVYWSYILPRLTPSFLLKKVTLKLFSKNQQPDVYERSKY